MTRDLAVFEPLWAVVDQADGGGAHDISHTRRVFATTWRSAQAEGGADWMILGAAAILHDIARDREDSDLTGKTDHAALGAQMALDILQDQGWAEDAARHISACIRTHRFRSGEAPQSLEARILFDADKLDCFGAVGLVRLFVHGAQMHQTIYQPYEGEAAETYNRSNVLAHGKLTDPRRHAPNIEYAMKVKRVTFFTDTARATAQARLPLMETFFEALRQETAET
jgi:uncharacterized protein